MPSYTAPATSPTVLNALADLSTSQGPAALDAISGQAYSGFATANLVSGLPYMNVVRPADGLPARQRRGVARASRWPKPAIPPPTGACDGDIARRWSAWVAGVGGTGSVVASGAPVPARSPTIWAARPSVPIIASTRASSPASASVIPTGPQWVNGPHGHATTDSFNLSLYGSYTEGAFYLDALVGYATTTTLCAAPFRSRACRRARHWARPMPTSSSARSRADTRSAIAAPAALSLTPFVRLQASTGTQAGFSETGADSLNLTVAQQTTNALRSTFGVDFAGAIDAGSREKLAFRVRVGWAHEYADTARPMTASFAGSPSFGFTVLGAAQQRDSAVVGLALNTAIAAATSIYVRYDGELGQGSDNHVFSAGLRMTW